MTSARGVGLCLDREGAVFAVIGADTYRLLAVAKVGWPVAGPASGAKVLAQARRGLRLPRRERVAVVHATERSIVDIGDLLTRARLAEAGVIPPNRAVRLGSSVDIVSNPRFADVAGDRPTILAVGAALAGLLDHPVRPRRDDPPRHLAPLSTAPLHRATGVAAVPAIDRSQWEASVPSTPEVPEPSWLVPDGPGWLVQRVDGTAEPRVTVAANAR